MEEKTFSQTSLTIAPQTVFTSGADTDVIRILLITNVTDQEASVDVWRVSAGGLADDSNKIVSGLLVPGNDLTQIVTYLPLDGDGDFIVANCSVDNAITLHICGATV